ncbi:MAG: hypothetical protein AMK70_15755 [Nitrospira bacterium SG8_35_1]|nr:MAG: hypothetical protein AMK70_15755 [Nitrospira bacterium SG8_35_1]
MEVQCPTHDFKIFTFLLVQEWTGLVLKPLQLGAPVSVFVRLITAILRQFFSFFMAVPNLISLY